MGRGRAAETFTKPTAEELSMKELKGYPGAAAVVLYREEISKDDIKVVQHYERIKILTEKGKDYANVELPYVTTTGGSYGDNDLSVGDIVGRTIHADGTVVPFTGKPYLKVVEKTRDAKFQKKVFTLPGCGGGKHHRVPVTRRGMRMTRRLSPDWYIQGELYVKAAHYQWFPTTHDLVDSKIASDQCDLMVPDSAGGDEDGAEGDSGWAGAGV